MHRDKIVLPTKEMIQRAAEILRRGDLVGIPTETVYGLAANALDDSAVQKIFAAKGRPSSNPLIVHLASVSQMSWIVDPLLAESITDRVNLLSKFWPGPFTVVVPRSSQVPDSVTAGLDTVAIRIPHHAVARDLILACGFPLAAPSANRSNYVSPTLAMHVVDGLGDQVEMVIDGGPCGHGIESTIVKLDRDKVVLLRPGVITRQQISDCLNEEVKSLKHRAEDTPVLAPGMLKEHYSPTTPLRFADQVVDSASLGRVGRIAFRPLSDDETNQFASVEVLSQTGDLLEIARNIFGSIRRLDGEGLDLLLVDRCEPVGVGEAIMDRLNRATTPTSRN